MRAVLTDLFNDDFAGAGDSRTFHARFFGKTLSLRDLAKISAAVCASTVTLEGKTIPGAVLIKGSGSGKPYALLAQLHGNEPAGLAGIALAMALSAAGKLSRDVIGIVGNPVAAEQYFTAWEKNPSARQETRDAYRGGMHPDGSLMPDMNRIPVDFLSRAPDNHHIKRAQELYVIGKNSCGILDIHSARGNMLCMTDHKRDADLKDSPIRAILTGLAEAISVHASAGVTVQTLKTILTPLTNIESQMGIEAGRHESADAPHNAASYTLSLLHTLGFTSIAPLFDKENGVFERYAVQPRITYNDLAHAKTLRGDDHVYMAKTCHSLASVPARSDTVVVKKKDGWYALQSVADFTRKPAGEMEFALYQYDEMEAVAKGQAVAVAIPSGTAFAAKEAFSGIFFSKSAALYDKDPTVGPWPVAGDTIAGTKFCYPCKVSEMKIRF